MECEICGAEVETLYEIEIEGTTMLVCSVCARGKHLTGKVVKSKEEADTENKAKPGARPKEKEELEIIDNYGEVIRKAREKLGLPLKVLAEKISEKESTLERVENQKTLPNDKLVSKLEKELGIKLTRPVEQGARVSVTKPSEPLSLWDAAEKKKKG
ncbi:MAG: multiprotein bridging factor aMBF1 [Candidatus Micrarchaeia archaeon]|jgi:putative transcription factor